MELNCNTSAFGELNCKSVGVPRSSAQYSRLFSSLYSCFILNLLLPIAFLWIPPSQLQMAAKKLPLLGTVPAAYNYEDLIPSELWWCSGTLATQKPRDAGDKTGLMALWKSMKVRVLSKSVHKGKVVHITHDSTGESFDSVSAFYDHLVAGGHGLFRIELEHMAEQHDSFLARVSERAAARATEPYPSEMMKRFARDLSQTSNAIEGNTSSSSEVDAVIATRTVKDEAGAEILGHFDVAHSLLTQPVAPTAVNISTLESWHAGLNIAGLVPSKIGRIRREGSPEVYIKTSGHRFVPSTDVPAALEDMFGWLRGLSLDHSNGIRIAAEAHYRMVHIHPFVDGNGRISRLFMNAILIAAAFPMTSIMMGMETVYFAALHAIDRGESKLLLERIIAEAVWRTLEIDSALLSSGSVPSMQPAAAEAR